MSNEMLSAALSYAARGFAVFPVYGVEEGRCACGNPACGSPAKHPMTPGGCRDATRDEATIRRWWTRYPTANLGVATGAASWVWVLDLDEEGAFDRLTALLGERPSTMTVATSRGLHLYWRFSPGMKNRVRVLPGIDVRGEGGYVLAPPSRHISGAFYLQDPEEPEAPAEAPPALLALAKGTLKPTAPAYKAAPASPAEKARGGLYGAAALASAAMRVRTAPEGTRHDTMNRQAYALGQLVGGGALTAEEVEAQLVPAALDAGLAPSEIKRTIASALRAGQLQPRTPPAPKHRPPALPGSATTPQGPSPAEPQAAHEGEEPFLRGDETELAHTLLAELAEGGTPPVGALGGLWCYDPSRGVYHKPEKEEIERRVMAYAGRAVRYMSLTGEPKLRPLKVGSQATRGARVLAYAQAFQEDFFSEAPYGLAFKNGFLTFDEAEKKMVLKEHAPENRARFTTGCDYDPRAAYPLWEKYLASALGVEKSFLLQEVAGVFLFGRATTFAKAALLSGGGDNGKSQAIFVLEGLFPETVRTSIRPQDFGKEYYSAALAGSLLNSVADIPSAEILNGADFKGVVTGDSLSGRNPRGEVFKYRPRAGHIFSANELPRVLDHSRGFRRRFIVIPFTRVIPAEERILDLGRKVIEEELPGVYAWAVEGAARALARGFYRIPRECERAVARWLALYDVLALWTDSYLERNPSPMRVSLDEIYADYRQWSEKGGFKPKNKSNFWTELPRHGWEKIRTNRANFWMPPAVSPIQAALEEEAGDAENGPDLSALSAEEQLEWRRRVGDYTWEGVPLAEAERRALGEILNSYPKPYTTAP